MTDNAGWQAGDIALCIAKRPDDHELEIGGYYSVDKVGFMFGATWLKLKELPVARCGCGCGEVCEVGWRSTLFRKVRPDPKEGAGEFDFRRMIEKEREIA